MDPGIRIVNDEDIPSHHLQAKVIALMLVVTAVTAILPLGKGAQVVRGALGI
jgi:hypothetical protein